MTTQTADREMYRRYSEVCELHPDTIMVPVASLADFSDDNWGRFKDGTTTHVIVQRGSCLFVTWMKSSELRFFFDAYSTQ
jgi:hypothetical protein